VQRTRIKFCGITRPTDAIAAANAGADAIGLIFYPKSHRYVTIDTAQEILAVLPPMISPIGLFVNSPVDEIRKIATALKLRTIQLHGQESPKVLEELSEFNIIKAIKCDKSDLKHTLELWTHSKNLSAILLETAGTPEPGGTGIENDWAGIEAILKSKMKLPPLIAAGGLTPENVGDVVRRLRPYAVDVSTGIEENRGIKSVDKMIRFAAEVYEADNEE
jgi:phosphoribosylanthranilate isomerase